MRRAALLRLGDVEDVWFAAVKADLENPNVRRFVDT